VRAGVLNVPGQFRRWPRRWTAAQSGRRDVLAAGSYNDAILLDNLHGITLRGQGQVSLAAATWRRRRSP